MRSLRATAALNGYLTACPGGTQVAELTRTVSGRTGTRREGVFLTTSRAPARADCAPLFAWIRGHWSVESRTLQGYPLRDGTFGEDRSRRRGGHAHQIMATLRTLCLTLIRRAFAYRPDTALLLPEAPPA